MVLYSCWETKAKRVVSVPKVHCRAGVEIQSRPTPQSLYPLYIPLLNALQPKTARSILVVVQFEHMLC